MARITWILVLVAGLAARGTASDHPLDGRTFKLWTTGSDGDAWERGISWSGGHWLYAAYPKMTDVMPVLFKAVPGEPNQYKLQNTWGFEHPDPFSQTWISFADRGTWLRTTYNEVDAMPIYFHRVVSTITTKENNTLKEYKMKNMYPGQDGWLSFRDSDKAIRATYTEKDAMNVALFDVEVHDGPDMHGRMPCSSGECHGRNGCSRGGECRSSGNCLCVCIPPWEPKSCSIEAAIVDTMSTMELATAKKIPEQGWMSMPAIAVGAGVAAAFGLFVVLEAKRRFAIQQPDGFVAMPADGVQPSC